MVTNVTNSGQDHSLPFIGSLYWTSGPGYIADMSRKLPSGEASGALKLQDFLPYRLAVLAESVSRSIAQVYAERFALTRDELARAGRAGRDRFD